MTDTNFRKAETLFSALKIQHSNEGRKQQASKQASKQRKPQLKQPAI
jgi:hypothetical protein